MLEIRRLSFNFVVKLNMQIADVQFCFIPKTTHLSRLVITCITLTTDDRAVNWRSRSFKVINFCCNRKPIYDLLLVINCHLGSISHHFRDITSRSRKPPTLLWAPRPSSNFVVKRGRQIAKALSYISVSKSEPPTLLWVPDWGALFEFCYQTWQKKS